MSKLKFYYSSMNAGKSLHLLQSNYKHQSDGRHTILYTAEIDDRYGVGTITSRLGVSAKAETFNEGTDFFTEVLGYSKNKGTVACYIDESQFLKKEHVDQLCRIVDDLGIEVCCYGLRTDFNGELFEGSQWLLAHADELVILEGLCWCGEVAGMCLKIGLNGEILDAGESIEVGLEDKYRSVCRKHWKEKKVR